MTRRQSRSKGSSRPTSKRAIETLKKSPQAAPDQPPQNGDFRRAWGKSARWAAGVLATALAAFLVTVLLRLPPWVGAHLSGSGPALTVTASPEYLNDEGRTLATPSGSQPGPPLLSLMSQPMAAVSSQFLREVRAIGGVNVQDLSVQLIVTGQSSQGVRIIDVRPVSLHRAAPLGGTLFWIPAQAGAASIRMMFNLNELEPIARQAKSTDFGWEPGNPFFDSETITLAKGEQQVLAIRALVNQFYATFDLEIDYIVGSDSANIHKIIVSDHGQPFRVTGMHPGIKPNTLSYQDAFELDGNYGLCQISKPGEISTDPKSPPPSCR